MAGLVQQGVDLRDGHALGAGGDLHDLVAGFDLSLLQDAEVEAGPAMGDEERCHLRLVHPDADPVASDARLGHLEKGAPDPVAIADADLVIGQAVDGEILPELPIGEVASAEMAFPIAIGVDLIDEDGPVLAAVPRQISLAIAIDVEPPHRSPALNGRFPDGGVDGPSLPCDVPRQADVDRKQARHRCFSDDRGTAAPSDITTQPIFPGWSLSTAHGVRAAGPARAAASGRQCR